MSYLRHVLALGIFAWFNLTVAQAAEAPPPTGVESSPRGFRGLLWRSTFPLDSHISQWLYVNQ